MISATSERTTRLAPPQSDRLVPRLLLGRELRRLRHARGLSRDEAGRSIGASGSKIGRLELGRNGLRAHEVGALLTRYGVDDEGLRAGLLSLVAPANEPAWWHDHREVVQPWKQTYLSAECAARLVRCFENRFVPVLLQTEVYCRETIRLLHRGISDREMDLRVDLVLKRQRILRRRPRPTNLWAVLDEAVLRFPVESADTLRDQIAYLLELCQRPNVTLQVLPSSALHTGAEHSFTLLRFPQPALTDMVYYGHSDSPPYPQARAEIERHWHLFNTLVTESAPPEQTAAILRHYQRAA